MQRIIVCLIAFWVVLIVSAPTANASLLMKPAPNPALNYAGKILEGDYRQDITHPDEVLGFAVGQRVATPDQIMQAIDIWAKQSDRLRVIEYARSHEGRPLYAVLISSPKLLAQETDILQKVDALADPRKTSDTEAEKLIRELPAIAWMAYSIHGNETSGADAALAAIYHLIAAQDQATADMLEDMVVVIDPIMNPDGRARFAKSLEQYRGTAPNIDDQSLLHQGDWPYGRTNHYFFDLNRDFFYLTQPETQGRVKLINRWRPQLMIDGHEMGAQDTYLMGPPRQPLNTNISASLQEWAKVFARDQGAAFDQRSWRYYTGEWFENWYPGYSNYAEYRGSMHILYEQSRMAEDGVKRPEGTVQTYMESVHHQFVSTIVNLQTLAQHSDAMYADYWQARKENVAKKGPYANKTYIIQATDNQSRLSAFVDKLQAQDIEVYVATKLFTAEDAVDQLGQVNDVEIQKGSLIIRNRQPEARLLAAIMEFDAQVSAEVLREERQKLLRSGQSIMYDTTAWNLSMMYGLEAYEVPEHIDGNIVQYTAPGITHSLADNAIAWSVNGADDNALGFAAQLMEQGIQVRVADKQTTFNQRSIARGSVFVTRMDNLTQTDLEATLLSMADKFSLGLSAHTSGFGEGDLPDWGGRHFKLLQQPRIGLLSHGNVSSYDVGATWWGIDSYLGLSHSQVNINMLTRIDLRRYNVLILPVTFGKLEDSHISALNEWIKQGGTLIAHGASAGKLAKNEGASRVRQIHETFDKASEYNIALQREWLASYGDIDLSATQSHTLPADVSYPWTGAEKSPSKDLLKQHDDWQKLFMPRGAMVAGRTDQEHWLTFGVNSVLPLLYGRQPVLMAADGVDSVVRVGVYVDAKTSEESLTSWYTQPNDTTTVVRMSGLLWPEAAQRIAHSAYVTREKAGKGQVILFSGQPNFRGATRGVNRILLNAIVFGPGFGTSPYVEL
ncbi:M14 family zinc carboxypeptidase [Alteromonas flava]|uniref:M14 family zinc carboxypeptidase n=1 Tax=Alteromonas flava TaxID=2048003 RepID=UPI000C2821EC|nr:M14 family zinc carboxypeptidase [Alteromonas flava]